MSRTMPPRLPLAALALALAMPALAQQTPPTGGSVLQQPQQQRDRLPPERDRPAPPVEAGEASAASADRTPMFVLTAVRVSGQQALSEAQLQAVAAPWIGTHVSMADLQAMTAAMTRRYRDAGYPLARAWLEPQSIRDGQVQVRMLEGTLEAVELRNGSRIRDAALDGLLQGLTPGQALREADLDRVLMLVDEQPGVGAMKASLRPGDAQGSTMLGVQVDAASRPGGRLSVDNHGNRYTGRARLGVELAIDNLAGRGDRLALQLNAAKADSWTGQLGWDTLLAANGLRGGLQASRGEYALGGSYANLEAHGWVRSLGATLAYPALRTRSGFVDLGLQVQRRELRDRIDLMAMTTDKHADVLVLSGQGRHRDGGGATAWNLAATVGRLGIDTASARSFDAVTARTEGGYRKLNASVLREQRLADAWGLRGLLSTQLASGNLDPSEKFVLGGPWGVRAHAVGEAAGDTGWLARLDLLWAFAPQWQAGLGYDLGQVRLNKTPWFPEQNTQRRRGVALSVGGSVQSVDLGLTVARPQGEPGSEGGKTQWWLDAGWRF